MLAVGVPVGVGDASLQSSTLSTESALASFVSLCPLSMANESRTWPRAPPNVRETLSQGVWPVKSSVLLVPTENSSIALLGTPPSRLSRSTVALSVRSSADSCVSNLTSNDTRVGACE